MVPSADRQIRDSEQASDGYAASSRRDGLANNVGIVNGHEVAKRPRRTGCAGFDVLVLPEPPEPILEEDDLSSPTAADRQLALPRST